jgi:hypothetical protein
LPCRRRLGEIKKIIYKLFLLAEILLIAYPDAQRRAKRDFLHGGSFQREAKRGKATDEHERKREC